MRSKILYLLTGAIAFNLTVHSKIFDPDQAFESSEFAYGESRIDSIDLFFEEYEAQATVYLSRKTFEGTPMTGPMMAKCARNAYDSTGVIVPLDLALAQAQFESGMGRRGRSPKNNPYNIGEWEDKTVTVFKSTEQGVQSYYYLIASDYLVNKTAEDLYTSFVNVNGHRYASGPDYETKIGNQASYIQRWIEKNIEKEV